MTKLYVISHIFNEEYLLPFWLEHHSKIFDYGIIIDYYSTDNSVEIIHKICPHWKVIKTKNINNDGSPNFDAHLIDIEVKEVEQSMNGTKICLNTTEFLMVSKDMIEMKNTLCENTYYEIPIFSVTNKISNYFPNNMYDFFGNITHVCDINKRFGACYRYMHSSIHLKYLNYGVGRHNFSNNENLIKCENHGMIILHMRYYPRNENMIKRRLQIQNNIPQQDKDRKLGVQHIIDYNEVLRDNDYVVNNIMVPILDHPILHFVDPILNKYRNKFNKIYNEYIYYPELLDNSKWGEDNIFLESDFNLVKNTSFDDVGYTILPLTSTDLDVGDNTNDKNINEMLQNIIKNTIFSITNKNINLNNYHNEIKEEEHTQILNAMPYKRDINPEFCNYLENTISEILNEKVKIFNDDLWFRICRPTNIYKTDFNPCHRDIYLDFYRNLVNIYLPVIGSNEKSSLTIQPGSHKWNENQTRITNGGAFFPNTDKKYSVDAIVASRVPLNMIRPNPNYDQFMLFSPYLIHGCANNDNIDTTRISLEIRFIRDDENRIKQEKEFNEYLKIRTWR